LMVARELEIRSRCALAETETKKTLAERLFAEQRDARRAFFYRSARCRLDASDLAQEIYIRVFGLAAAPPAESAPTH
jgi:DNA-directed RNA polymerase specialized sigma24 family protein